MNGTSPHADRRGNVVLVEGNGNTGLDYGWVHLIDGDSGRRLKTVPLERGPSQTVAISPSGVFVATGAGLEKVDPYAGVHEWTSSIWPRLLRVDPRGDVLVAGGGWSAAKVQGDSGAVIWRTRELPGHYAPVVAEVDGAGNLLIGIAAGVGKLSGETGEWLWRTFLPGESRDFGGLALDAHGNAFLFRGLGRENPATFTVSVSGLSGTDGSEVFRAVSVSGDFPLGVAPFGGGFALSSRGPDGPVVAHYAEVFGLAASDLPMRPGEGDPALPAAPCGSSYEASLEPVNGQPPYRFSIGPEDVPAGLSLDEEAGAIRGVAGFAGTHRFSVRRDPHVRSRRKPRPRRRPLPRRPFGRRHDARRNARRP